MISPNSVNRCAREYVSSVNAETIVFKQKNVVLIITAYNVDSEWWLANYIFLTFYCNSYLTIYFKPGV